MLKKVLIITGIVASIMISVVIFISIDRMPQLESESFASEGEFPINQTWFNDGNPIVKFTEEEGQIYVTVVDGEKVITNIITPMGRFSIMANQDKLEIDFNGNIGIFNGNASVGD